MPIGFVRQSGFALTRGRRTIQFWLAILVIGCILPAALLATFLIIRSYLDERDRFEQSMLATANALLQTVDGEMRSIVSQLEILAASNQISPEHLAEFHKTAKRIADNQPGTNIVLLLPSGQQIVNTLKPYGSPLPPDSSSGKWKPGFAAGQPFVSDLFVGPIEKRLVIGVGVPVFIGDTIAYGLGMGITTEFLGGLLRRQNLPHNWVASIFDGTGTIAARTLSPEQFVGKKVAPGLLQRLPHSSAGMVETNTLEGIRVIASYSVSPTSRWGIVVGVPATELTSVLHRSLLVNSLLTGILLASCLLMTWIISWRLNQSLQMLVGAALSLGSREASLVPVSNITEVDVLGEALVKASLLIEERVAAEGAAIVAQKHAEAAAAAQGQFLATMSHELRTPLNSIIGFSDVLLHRQDLAPDVRRQIGIIQTASDALLSVVNDVLDFSKIEEGKFDLVPVEFDLRALFDGVVAVVRGSADANHLELHTSFDERISSRLIGDDRRIRQVLFNLLNNAIKFTRKGQVSLGVELVERIESCEQIRVSIVDTGIGIPESKLDKLFQRFSQVDSSTSREYGGSGLGLAISKRLVELMGGQIGVHSSLGTGSTFWFLLTLPSTPLALTEVEDAPQLASAPASAHLLLVEDIEVNREIACAVLQRLGYRVDAVTDGSDAVAAVKSGRYDLVLMDIQMPGMDGITATRLIRALPGKVATIPIVAMTANVLAKQIETVRSAGMNGHIGKPFKPDELKMEIERCLSEPRSTSQVEASNTSVSSVLD